MRRSQPRGSTLASSPSSVTRSAPSGRFAARAGTGVVNENSPHHSRRQREEMHAGSASRPPLAEQAQIGFVDQGRRLQGVALAVTAKLPRGTPPELARRRAATTAPGHRGCPPTRREAVVSPPPLAPIACLRATPVLTVTQRSPIFRVT